MTSKNVLDYAQDAIDFGAKECLEKCKDFFKKNTKAILAKKEFLDISVELLEVLSSVEGPRCSVMESFAAYMTWAAEECKRRNLENSPENLKEVLGNVLDNIKFEYMPMEDFLEFVVPEQILTNERVGHVINNKQKGKKYDNWTEVVSVRIFPISKLVEFLEPPNYGSLHTTVQI